MEYYHYLEDITADPAIYYTNREKEEWAIVGASELVGKLMKARDDDHLFSFWKRVSRTEKQATFVTRMLGDQALALRNCSLFMHWTRVRIVISNRSYL